MPEQRRQRGDAGNVELVGMDDMTREATGWRSQRRRGLACAVAMVLAALVATPAFAHKASVFATVRGKTVSGEAYFRDGTPLRGARITVLDPDGKQLAETQTDSEGKFSVPLVRRCDHRLVVDAGDGHAAESMIRAEEIPADLPGEKPPAPPPAAPPPAPGTQSSALPAPGRSDPASDGLAGVRAELEALQTQLVQLRRDLAAREDRARWSDVLGGIGYILGLMGLAFYFLGASARTRRPASRPEPTPAAPDSRLNAPP